MTLVEDKTSVQLHLQMLEARLQRQQKEIGRLRADQKVHEDLFKAIGAAVFILDPHHGILDINPAASQLLGADPEAVRGKPCYTIMHGTDAPPGNCPLTAVLATKQYATGPMYVESLDRHVWVSCTPVFDDAGDVAQVIHIADDITEQVRMRDQLAASEKRLRTILDALPDMVLETDTDHHILWANQTALSENPNAIGKTCFNAFGPKNTKGPCHGCVCGDAVKTGEMTSAVSYRPRVNGDADESWWHDIGIPLKDEGGEVTRLIEFSRNITEDMVARRDLEASERQFRLLAENSDDVIWTMGGDGRLIYINPAVERLLGYLPSELVGKLAGQQLSQVLLPSGLEMAKAELDRFWGRMQAGTRDESPIRMEMALQNRDGRIVMTEVGVNAVFDRQGDFRFFIGISRDITDRQKREEALRQANKLEAVGVLAGGLAHDFNNLLSIILGNLEMASEDMCGDRPRDPYLEAAQSASLRARELTHQLLAFAKGGDPVKRMTPLGDVVKDALERTAHKQTISPRVHISPDLDLIAVDRLQLVKALSNIIQNGIEAMPKGGELTISAEAHRFSQGQAPPTLATSDSTYIRLTIADQGCGIPDAARPQIFDPYFTTKAAGAQKGLGLGLTLAYAVVKKHGGEILVDTTVGQGSCFTLLLPEGGEPTPRIMSHATPATAHRVLLMDDEEQLRVLSEQMLTHLGYVVETVADGQSAVRAYKRAKDAGVPFGLVILDLTVKSGMGGREAMSVLQKVDPGVLAVVSSGYSEDPVMTTPRQYGFTGVLPKPYSHKELMAVLGKAFPKPPA